MSKRNEIVWDKHNVWVVIVQNYDKTEMRSFKSRIRQTFTALLAAQEEK